MIHSRPVMTSNDSQHFERPTAGRGPGGLEPLFEVVHEDADLLVVNKPAGLVCHPTKGDVFSSLISRLRLYLATVSASVPAPHLVNRLDRETSGIILAAKNLEKARELRRLWESRCVTKEYQAIVQGAMREEHGLVDAPLGRDDRSPVAIKDRVRLDGAAAQTEFWVEQVFSRPEGQFSLLKIRLITGRKHQIRIHLAHLGHPIVGDKLYGPDEDHYLALVQDRITSAIARDLLLPNHALHAQRIQYQTGEGNAVFQAPPERWFPEFIQGRAWQEFWPVFAS